MRLNSRLERLENALKPKEVNNLNVVLIDGTGLGEDYEDSEEYRARVEAAKQERGLQDDDELFVVMLVPAYAEDE